MNSIIKWHLKQRKMFIFWWCFAIVGFIGLNLAFYPSFKDQAAALEQSLNQLPEAAIALFSDTGDFFSPEGYLSSQVFYLMLPMLLSIVAISLGSSLIAKEEKEGTLELILSRPISRTQVLASKAVSGLLTLLIITAVVLIAIVILCSLVNIPISLMRIALATLASAIFAISIGTIAFALSALGSFGRGMSIGITTAIALSGYILSSLIGVAQWLRWPARILPFYYYHPAEILSGSYNWINMTYFLGVVVIGYIVSVLAFRKRDLG